MTVDLLRRISQEVFKSLGTGHSERVYHKGIIAVLNSYLIFHRSEVATPIYMHGEVVGTGRADLVVGRIAVEIKALAQLPSRAFGQLAKYVNSLNKDVMDDFNQRCVQSSFFASSNNDEDDLSDANYHDELRATTQDLYSGVIINFNQRTGDVEIMTNNDEVWPFILRFLCVRDGFAF